MAQRIKGASVAKWLRSLTSKHLPFNTVGQGLWILSCEEAIQLANRMSVFLLLRCPFVPEVMHWRAPEVFLHQLSWKVYISPILCWCDLKLNQKKTTKKQQHKKKNDENTNSQRYQVHIKLLSDIVLQVFEYLFGWNIYKIMFNVIFTPVIYSL
jgi:hypothetical protein